MLLDDPSPLVRGRLAEALAVSEQAPPPVILGARRRPAGDRELVLERSPLLLDADLVDAVATGRPRSRSRSRAAPNCRARSAAAIAEVGAAEACLTLIENDSAEIAPFSLDRIVERHGHLAAIREAMLAREDLPAATRQALVAQTLARRSPASSRRAPGWTRTAPSASPRKPARRRRSTLAADSPTTEIAPLIRHLRESGQLTAGLILRALLSGNVRLFEQALAELSDLPLAGSAAWCTTGAARLPRALRARPGCRPRLRGVPRGARCACTKAASSASRAARRGSSAAWSSACSRAARTSRSANRAAAAAAAPLRDRGGARRGAHVLRRAGGRRCDRSPVAA